MRAAVLREGRMVYRDDVPEPVPESGQVLVAVRSCGICGTDQNAIARYWSRRNQRFAQPFG
jgi:threonine dehydrogenase-like Zn-dependent dehydrogenase